MEAKLAEMVEDSQLDRRGFLSAATTIASIGLVGCLDDVYAREKKKGIEKPRYHPSIENYEKDIEEKVSLLVPTHYEFEEGFILKDSILRKKVLEVRKRPSIVQDNEYHKEFLKHLDYHYKNPDEKGFLGGEKFYSTSLSELLKNKEGNKNMNEMLKESFGFTINLEKPTEPDKSMLFLGWMVFNKYNKINENNKNLLYKVLDDINKSGRMPTENYKDNKLVKKNYDYAYSIDYKDLLEKNISGLGLIIIDNITPKTSVRTTSKRKDGGGPPSTLPPQFFRYKSFNLKRDEKIFLGMSFGDRKGIKNGTIELYNPKGKKILRSRFKIDDNLEKGKVDIEKTVRKHSFGVYTAGFFVDDKCWAVRQFEIKYD